MHLYFMKYFLFCFGLISVAKAQNYNPDAVNKKAAVTYSKAIEILQNDLAKIKGQEEEEERKKVQ